jgi:hypothetical protein
VLLLLLLLLLHLRLAGCLSEQQQQQQGCRLGCLRWCGAGGPYTLHMRHGAFKQQQAQLVR